MLGGGGVHGLSYVGVLLALETTDPNLVSRFNGCVGTSVGALIGLGVGLGLSARRLHALVIDTIDWTRLHVGIDLKALVERHGLETREGLAYLARLVLSEAGLSETATLCQIHKLTQKHFCCVVADLTQGQARYFDHLTMPHMRVEEAVVTSMCVPMLFEPVTIGASICVDGGIVDNLPVHFFDMSKSLVLRIVDAPPYATSNWHTYIASALLCAARGKERKDAELAHSSGARVVEITVPMHFPPALELRSTSARLAQSLITMGFLQALSGEARGELPFLIGRAVQLACCVHNSMPELP